MKPWEPIQARCEFRAARICLIAATLAGALIKAALVLFAAPDLSPLFPLWGVQ